jgi:hypothetical protein
MRQKCEFTTQRSEAVDCSPQDDTNSHQLQVASTESVARLVSCTSRLVPVSTSQVVSLRSVVGEGSLVVIMRVEETSRRSN